MMEKLPKWKKQEWELALDRFFKRISNNARHAIKVFVKVYLKKMFDYLMFYKPKGRTKLDMLIDKIWHIVEMTVIYSFITWIIFIR